MWLKTVQSNHFKDTIDTIDDEKGTAIKRQLGLIIDPDNGLLRCKGLMKNADLCEAARRPIFLPKRDRYVSCYTRHIESYFIMESLRQYRQYVCVFGFIMDEPP